MGDSARCMISIEDGRTGLPSDLPARPRNLARNARVSGIALRSGGGGDFGGKRSQATQSPINATSKLLQSVLIANRLRPQSHPKATPKPPQCVPNAPPKPPQS